MEGSMKKTDVNTKKETVRARRIMAGISFKLNLKTLFRLYSSRKYEEKSVTETKAILSRIPGNGIPLALSNWEAIYWKTIQSDRIDMKTSPKTNRVIFCAISLFTFSHG
jgi:hypothetical protein